MFGSRTAAKSCWAGLGKSPPFWAWSAPITVSVNSRNAVDKREQPPKKDGYSLFHVNARLRRKKMERRLQERQIPIGLLSKQVVLQVEEAAQFSGGGIRYKVKEPVLRMLSFSKTTKFAKGIPGSLSGTVVPAQDA